MEKSGLALWNSKCSFRVRTLSKQKKSTIQEGQETTLVLQRTLDHKVIHPSAALRIYVPMDISPRTSLFSRALQTEQLKTTKGLYLSSTAFCSRS